MRIAVFLPESPWGAIDETAMGKGLGGRETALVELAWNWAMFGHEVYAFVPRDDMKYSSVASAVHFWDLKEMPMAPVVGNTVPNGSGWQSIGFVRWIPYEKVLDVAPVLGLDLFVSWENLDVFEQLGMAQVGRRVVEMQVAHLEASSPVQFDFVDEVACLSTWARDFLKTQLPKTKQWQDNASYPIFPNGVDLSRFEIDYEDRVKFHDSMEPGKHFIYSSSPDRGLHHLLTMWPDIRASVYEEYGVESYLHVCYGAEQFVKANRWAHNSAAERAITIERLMDLDGVIYHGKIGQDELAKLMIACDALLYPCDTMSPTETGCITIVEAIAAGTTVVTTECDCLGSEFRQHAYMVPMPLDHSQYLDMIGQALRDQLLDTETTRRRTVDRELFAASRDWSVIAAEWILNYKKVAA